MLYQPIKGLHYLIDNTGRKKSNKEENNSVSIAVESFGLLVLLGFGLSTFTPIAYQRSHLLRPYKEVSSRG